MMKILLLVRAQINVHSVESFPMTILELPAHYEFLNCENFQKYFFMQIQVDNPGYLFFLKFNIVTWMVFLVEFSSI